MTVAELLYLCNKWERQGKGHWPVQILNVEEGLPTASDIDIEPANVKDDGERVWIHPKGEPHLPEWLDKE